MLDSKRNKETEKYDYEKFPKTSARKGQFKKENGGTGAMCELLEEYAEEKRAEGRGDAPGIQIRNAIMMTGTHKTKSRSK